MNDLKDMIPILRSLGISPEQLGPDKLEKLKTLADTISNPSEINEMNAISILRELGIGLGENKKNTKEVENKFLHKIGRNEKCLCGSLKKYKHCCGKLS